MIILGYLDCVVNTIWRFLFIYVTMYLILVEEGLSYMELLTVEETAKYLKMSPQVIRRWLREKKLPGVKIGKEWRIDKQAIDDMLKQNK